MPLTPLMPLKNSSPVLGEVAEGRRGLLGKTGVTGETVIQCHRKIIINFQLTNEAMGRGCLADYPLQGGNQDAKGGLILNYQLSISLSPPFRSSCRGVRGGDCRQSARQSRLRRLWRENPLARGSGHKNPCHDPGANPRR